MPASYIHQFLRVGKSYFTSNRFHHSLFPGNYVLTRSFVENMAHILLKIAYRKLKLKIPTTI